MGDIDDVLRRTGAEASRSRTTRRCTDRESASLDELFSDNSPADEYELPLARCCDIVVVLKSGETIIPATGDDKNDSFRVKLIDGTDRFKIHIPA